MTRPAVPRVLSIAGSDSGGGAGIQADLKAFAACGVHGMTAITAVTAQSTVGVSAVHPVPPEVIEAQVSAVAADIGVDAVKIGMLGHAVTVRAVVHALAALPAGIPIVLDPVMVAESGARLLDDDALQALRCELIPRVSVITPNLLEARVLAGTAPATGEAAGTEAEDEEVRMLARGLHELGAPSVLVTGGHRRTVTDVLLAGGTFTEIPGERHPDGAGHGSGCTHSSVLAARLAWGDELAVAARVARAMAGRAVSNGLRELGAGAGPVNVLGIGR